VAAGRDATRLLGRVGIWANLDRLDAARLREFARAIDSSARIGALWFPETIAGKEAFSLATFLLASTERLVVATGIASVWARDAMAAANGSRAIGDWFPGRFVLGLGVSHAPSVATRGHSYAKPYERMREYLDALDATKYVGPQSNTPVPRVIAALGQRMLRLAADRAAGAHPYFVPVEHTSIAREVLGPEPLLAVEQAVVLATTAEKAREIARTHTRRYLGLENYANNLRRLGWSDRDLSPDGGSDALVDAIVACGDAQMAARRVEDHLSRGADHVCVQVILPEAGRAPIAEMRLLERYLPS
jgi:probable F420-dependent oxidoreductase